jgi:hypothetical protein
VKFWRAMSGKAKIPTELAAIAAVCCVAGSMLVLSVTMGVVLLPNHPYPDQVIQTLYADRSVRPLIIGEGIAAFLLGVSAAVTGVMVFARARSADAALHATLGLAALCILADVIVQGWLIVPALRTLAPTLKPLDAVFYDPRLRPWLPIAIGGIVLAVLFGIARILRRPHVRAALTGNTRNDHATGAA